MITIQQIDQYRISLRCHYAYGKRCREIPGAVFDYNRKAWIAPIGSLPVIQAAFAGEIYYKTPLWRLEGRFEPDRNPLVLKGPTQKVPDLEYTPYKYQIDGILFMIDRLNNVGFCLNGDGVGLGKTLQSIGTIKWFVENRGARKILIICKKSLKAQWAEEIRKISGWNQFDMPVFITGGSTKKRKLAPYECIQKSLKGILITNYEDFLNWKSEIDKVNYDICVVDEAHCIKGRDGKKNQLIADTCNGKRTILLTGTPILSRPDDIWGIVRLAAPNFFGEYEDFKGKYIVEEFNKKFFCREIVGAKCLDELQENMSEFLIMRSAEDAAIDLPKQKKARHISCPMDAVQIKLQAVVDSRRNQLELRKKALIEEHGLTDKTSAQIDEIDEQGNMYLASLQYIASDPAVLRTKFKGIDLTDYRLKRNINWQLLKMVPNDYKMSPKTEITLDLLAELIDADEKVIIFCYYASTAKMLYSLIKENQRMGKAANPVLYIGSTSDKDRIANTDAFRNDPECRVLIGNDAMAEGLNLQVSRHLIHYEQAETYAKRKQREGRIRRIGSTYDYINIIDICTGDSIDEIKISKLRRDYLTQAGTLAGAGNTGSLENDKESDDHDQERDYKMVICNTDQLPLVWDGEVLCL